MTSTYLEKRPRSRIEAAYDLAPELKEAVGALEAAHKAIEACLHAEQNPGNERIEAIAGEAVWEARRLKRAVLTKIEQAK